MTPRAQLPSRGHVAAPRQPGRARMPAQARTGRGGTVPTAARRKRSKELRACAIAGCTKFTDKIIELKPELEKCYLPCKSRTYLNDLNNKNVITILRQIVRPHGYLVYSREKYIRGDKFIIYQLISSEQRYYRPMAIDNTLISTS